MTEMPPSVRPVLLDHPSIALILLDQRVPTCLDTLPPPPPPLLNDPPTDLSDTLHSIPSALYVRAYKRHAPCTLN